MKVILPAEAKIFEVLEGKSSLFYPDLTLCCDDPLKNRFLNE
jgi:hypothetical protein